MLFMQRYVDGQNLSDLDKAISAHDDSVGCTPDFDPQQARRLFDLGMALVFRHQHNKGKPDTDDILQSSKDLGGNPGQGQSASSDRLGDAREHPDLDRALVVIQMAVDIAPDDSPDKRQYVTSLGTMLHDRFSRLRNIEDLYQAITVLESAINTFPEERDRNGTLHGLLGRAYRDRFHEFSNISDLDAAIKSLEVAVNLLPDDTSHQAILGDAYSLRYHRLGEPSDLRAWIQFTHQVTGQNARGQTSAVQEERLNNMAVSLVERFIRFGKLDDIDEAIEILKKLLAEPNRPDSDKPTHYSNLGTALDARFDRKGYVPDLEESVAAKQMAVDLTPDWHPDKALYLSNLSSGLHSRFDRLGSVADIDAAIVTGTQALELTHADDNERASRLDVLGSSFRDRYNLTSDMTDLDSAISTYDQATNLTPDNHPNKPIQLQHLGWALLMRFTDRSDISDLDRGVELMQQATKLVKDDEVKRPTYFNGLASALRKRYFTTDDIKDLEESLIAQQRGIDLLPDAHMEKHIHLVSLGMGLRARYERNLDISSLNASIAAQQKAITLTPDDHPNKPKYLIELAGALFQRIEAARDETYEDLILRASDAVLTASRSDAGPARVRLEAARMWCEMMERINRPEPVLEAYTCALALIPRVAWMGLAVEGRHQELRVVGSLVRKAAAAAVRYGNSDLALEWLEQGRSVVWGQTLQLRSPVDALRDKDPVRAERLMGISLALELTGKDTETPMENRGRNHRALTLEWEALLAEIRSLEGFTDFLGPKNIAKLLPAAHHGPVVVLNAHEKGCDALILIEEAGEVIHIPLEFTSERAQALCDSLTHIESGRSSGRHVDPADRGFRFPNQQATDTDDEIGSMLAELWDGIVKPVFDALAISVHEGGGDDLPRVWWCPTGPLAFLPIHAAGLYENEELGTKISDFVVSSYTPTVSALLHAPSSATGGPTILAVAQAATPGQSALPNAKREIELIRKRATANAVNHVVMEDDAGTVKGVVENMGECSWVHLACHGTQDPFNPTKSAFLLAGGNLELAEIIKHPLPHAEFAFLSACQTATGDIKLEDEAIHLAAGMLLAGYRSVIATMWAIMDNDGPVVADAVYAEMLKDGKSDHTRAAHALHHAVQQLRLSGAPFLSWLPFIHMGA